MRFLRQSFRAALLAGVGLAFGAASFLSAPPARALDQIGVLECNVAPGVGLVITSSRALACRFRPVNDPPQFYVGTIQKFGLDIGVSGPGKLVWTVFAAAAAGRHFVLAGEYVGATAGASIGAGLGANALVGGSGSSISLQPVSLNADTGFNLAAGVGDLVLEPAPPPMPH
ncbi:MAG: DUF992 domain-containing protein [Methylovirgula sp.]